MKHIFLLFLIFSCVVLGFSQKKSNLDLHFPAYQHAEGQPPQILPAGSMAFDHEVLENDKTAFSLLSDGYFTIGTTNGFSSGTLDDHCQITFGHPFALTSYPYFLLDGAVHHPELYFYSNPAELINQGDTLLGLLATDLEKIEFTFSLSQRNEGDIIRLYLEIKNIDDIPHYIGLGLLFDPAMGLWGDGFTWINGELIQEDTTFLTGIPTMFQLWERSSSPKGMGVTVEYINNFPSSLMLGNWYDLHHNLTPTLSQIYDLAIETVWNETLVNQSESISFAIDIQIQNPEFPNGVFMRADLPYFLSVENNLLFPRDVEAIVKLMNNGTTPFTNTNLDLFGDGYITNWTSLDNINISSNQTSFASASLHMAESYDEKIIEMELTLMDGAQILDQITRNLFVPAAPYSDSGLIVTIDTLILSGFPIVDLIFHSQIEETGQYLKNLTKENVFFYEDQVRIEDFTLIKDTSGGTNQADIIFVLDVTGSMSEEINGVKDNIVEFCDSLTYQGIDFRLGMVTFLDYIENIYDFTSNVQLFQQYINQQYAHGGDDWPENSLDALMAACQFAFRPAANRVFIWITDATYHINNNFTPLTPLDVVNAMLTHAVQPNGIGDTEYELDCFYPILIPTGGDFFDIDGNFRDILLEISRMNSTGSYRLSYLTNANPGDTLEDILEVHHAGLGGMDTITFVPVKKSSGSYELPAIQCFPNPFNATTSIEVANPQGWEARLEIYNIQGQHVFSKHFEGGQTVLSFTWDGRDGLDQTIINGLYFVQIELYNSEGGTERLPIRKLVYFNN